ncbi:MAG: HpcH/HpaI aldolase/citrate lyase family protein [Nocardioidaceae bacterium]
MSPRLRTALFVPGDRPDRIAKAVGYPTDVVVVDLEDAVADGMKEQARDVARRATATLEHPSVRLMVRVNPVDSPWFADDVAALEPLLNQLSAVVLPKATADDVRRLEVLLTRLESATLATRGTGILPIVETAAGVLDAAGIAVGSERVETLVFGVADLSAELRIEASAEGDELLHARSHMVLACAAAGRTPPVDGPYLRLDDPDGLETSVAHARRLGFGGKAVIHPRQLDAVTAAFSPNRTEVAWARAVDAAYSAAEQTGRGAVRLDDGTFVDQPVARRARAILAEAAAQEAT